MDTDEILSALPLWAKLPSNATMGQYAQFDGTKWVAVNLTADITASGENHFLATNYFESDVNFYIAPYVGLGNIGNPLEQLITVNTASLLINSALSGYVTTTALSTALSSYVGLNTNIAIGGNKSFTNQLALSAGIALAYQTAPAGTANFTSLYADSTGRLSWRNGTSFTRTFDGTSITANRTWSMPDADTTLAGLGVAQTFTQLQTFSRAIVNSAGTNANYGINISYSINNTGGTNTMAGIYLNATETAIVGTTHNLIDLQVSSASRFSVSRTGILTTSSHINSSGDFATTSSTGQFKINDTKLGRGGADGVFVMLNNAENSFNRLCFGGTTNIFPSIKRNSASLDFRLADDSGFATIQANAIIANSLIRCAASTTSTASLSIVGGTAPTAPNEGDIWNGGDGTLYMRIGGATKRFTMS